MSENEQQQRSLFSELNRRHVFRTAIAYAVASWAIVQVSDVMLPAFDGPEWGVRAITTVLVVGFPAVLILSWLFDIGGGGIVRTEDAAGAAQLRATRWFRLLVVVPTFVATAAVLWYLWSADLIVGEDNWEKTAKTNPVIAVLPVRNLTGDAELDWLGEGFASLLRNELASSKHTIIVSDAGLESILRNRTERAEIYETAADANVDYIVSGEIIRAANGLILTERVTDLENGIDIVAQSFPELTPETLIGSVHRLTRVIMQGLKLPYVQQQQSLAADFAVDNIAAYEAFNAGLEYFNAFEYDDAIRSLEAALELAPDFHIARYRLAHILKSTGQEQEAQEMIASIPVDAVQNRREELYIDAARAYIPRDYETAIERFKLLLEEFPYEVDAREFLSEAYYQNYQDAEAIEQLELIAVQEPENAHAWSTLGYYRLNLGQLDAARVAIDRYAEVNPEEAHPWILKGDLAQQENDFAAAIQHYDRALVIDADASLAALGSARARVVLDDREGAKTTLSTLVSNDGAIAADRTDAAIDLAFILRSELDFDASVAPLSLLKPEFEAEQILYAKALATEALSLMELGRSEMAWERIDEAIENSPGQPVRYLFAKGLMQLRSGQIERVAATADEILAYALPEEDGNQRAEKAADYLNGLAMLVDGKAEQAVEPLRRAVEAQGFEYAVYKLGLALAYEQSGFSDEALTLLEEASALQFEGNAVRIEFDLERRLAQQLRIELLIEANRQDEADTLLADYEAAWGETGPSLDRTGLPFFATPD